MPAYTKNSGAWKNVDSEYDCYIKVSGSWKKCDQVYVKINGTWKPCYSKAPKTQSNNMGLGTLPYAYFDEFSWSFKTPSWRTVHLSNVQVGSTITLTGTASANWISGGSDGGADEGSYAEFELDCGLNGAYFSHGNAVVDQWNWGIYHWGGRSNYVDGGITLVMSQSSVWGSFGNISVNFIATSSNVTITFAPIQTVISNANLAYTTLV